MPQAQRHSIGVFDSGVGGLSVVRAMLRLPRPHWTDLIYLADLGHFPYGPKPAAQVRGLAAAGLEVLAELGAELGLIACNTASASGIRTGTPDLALPILDIIGPGARRAAEVAQGCPGPVRVIVLGTEGTIRSGTWNEALLEAGYDGPVVGWPCPFLATIIEEGRDEPVLKEGILEATQGLRGSSSDAAVDIVVLGCTHFPLVTHVFEEVLSGEVLRPPVAVVDPAEALVSELVGRLEAGFGRRIEENERDPVEVRFLTTARAAHFRERASGLLSPELKSGRHRLRLDRVVEVSLAERLSGDR